MAISDASWPDGDGEMVRRIRAFDWAATSLGPIGGWSERLKLMVEQILATPLVATLVCGPDHVLVYNEAAAKLFGRRHPGALGRPLPETFPDGWATVADFYARAFAGETVQVVGQPLDTRGDGAATDVFDALLTPVRESDGRIAYVHMTGAEVSNRARIEAALRESEERYRSLFQNMGQGYCDLALLRDRKGRAFDQIYLELNPAFERLFGVPAAQAKGRTAQELFPDLEPWWYEAFDRITRRGEPERIEYEVAALGRWFEVFAYPRGGDRLTVLYEDVTARKHAELAAREAEKRQTFLLRLSDALRPLADPVAIQDAAVRLLGEHLQVSRAMYAEFMVEGGQELVVVEREHRAPDAVSFVGRHPAAQFGPDVHELRAGRIVVVPDMEAEPATEALRTVWRAFGARARLGIPLVKDGRLVAGFGVQDAEPRRWTEADIALVAEIAERTWAAVERARAEAALRESEARFAQFAASSSGALWIRNAETLRMEYVSPAIETVYGVEPVVFLNGVESWASAIVPDDRASALDHLEQARQGEAVVHEFRVQRPSDGAFRWIRNTDFPLYDEHERVQRIGGIAEDVTEAKLAVEHQGVLLAELQHRVRNIMAQIRSITARTGERAESVGEYAGLMAGRLLTFARVQALLTRGANVGVRIIDIVHDELAAQSEHEAQYRLEGPDLVLAPKTAEVLTLAAHELATNALKYGGLSVPEGCVTVRWATFERRGTPWLGLDWIEAGAPERSPADPSAPWRRGFGSELIEGRIPYELGGRGEIAIEPGGARCRLEFPLRNAPSILETDAPRRAAVYGGALDMTGEADLSGHRILVVEDDYYLATDTARALRGAGAEVIGPCPTEEAARDAIAAVVPTGAILDLNLGDTGPSFELATELGERGVPFILVTGYDAAVLPRRSRRSPGSRSPCCSGRSSARSPGRSA
jgi:PAS domain S-box-containing protein